MSDLDDFFGLTSEPASERPEARQLLDTLIVLSGHPYTKKNNATTVTFTRKDGTTGSTRINTKAYIAWEHKASAELGKLGHVVPISEPVNVAFTFYLQRGYRVDLSALYEGVQDLLVKAGVLTDDNYKIIASHDGSGVMLDKERPRTEILITKKAPYN